MGGKREGAWWCANCGEGAEKHFEKKCLFAPTKQLMRCTITMGYTDATADVFCPACIKYSRVEARGQVIASCPSCGVDFVPNQVWRNPYEKREERED